MVNAGRVSIVPKGQFQFGTQYTRLDLVTYENNAYVAIKDNIDILPTDENTWMFIFSGVNVLAENVSFKDEKDAETKVGAINGITSDLNCEDKSIAASAVALKGLNDSLGFDTKLIDGVPNWSPRGADTFVPFKSSLTKIVLANDQVFGWQNRAISVTASATNIPNYQQLTEDNFYPEIINISGNSTNGSNAFANIKKSYNKDAGIISFSCTSGSGYIATVKANIICVY